jgi:hypothetical protein
MNTKGCRRSQKHVQFAIQEIPLDTERPIQDGPHIDDPTLDSQLATLLFHPDATLMTGLTTLCVEIQRRVPARYVMAVQLGVAMFYLPAYRLTRGQLMDVPMVQAWADCFDKELKTFARDERNEIRVYARLFVMRDVHLSVIAYQFLLRHVKQFQTQSADRNSSRTRVEDDKNTGEAELELPLLKHPRGEKRVRKRISVEEEEEEENDL